MKQRHILIADPKIKNYVAYNVEMFNHMELRHCIPAMTLDVIPRKTIAGILLSKIEIHAGAVIEPEALEWVLSRLRDVKDDPSGIGT